MTEWFVIENDAATGPHQIDDLTSLALVGRLNTGSLIWRVGLEGWVPANTEPEIASLLLGVPPAIPSPSHYSATTQVIPPASPKTKRKIGPLAIILVVIMAIAAGSISKTVVQNQIAGFRQGAVS